MRFGAVLCPVYICTVANGLQNYCTFFCALRVRPRWDVQAHCGVWQTFCAIMLTLEDRVQLLRSTHLGAKISKIHALNPRLVHTHWKNQKAKTSRKN